MSVDGPGKVAEEWLEPVKHCFSQVREDWQVELTMFI